MMNNFLKAYLVFVTLVLFALIYRVFIFKETERELIVNKLSVVDRNSGKPVVVIADTVPEPILMGKELKGRIFKPRGIIYYDADGNETGGIIVDNNNGMENALITVDYNNTDAFNIFKQETDSNYVMGLSISDRNTAEEFEQRGSRGIPRIALQNRDKTAVIAMFDTKGKERVLFIVNDQDEVQMLVYDKDGNVIKDLLE